MNYKERLYYYNECFELNREEWKLYWKSRPEHHFKKRSDQRRVNTLFANREAGTIDLSNGVTAYRMISLKPFPSRLPVHRIIWEMVNGELLSTEQIDHINGDGLDNNITNMRVVNHGENMRNMPVRSDNKSGVVGVFYDNNKKKWVVKISGKYIGAFNSKQEAMIARESHPLQETYHKNHGRLVKPSEKPKIVRSINIFSNRMSMEDFEQLVIDRYGKNMLLREISEKYNVTTSTLSRLYLRDEILTYYEENLK